MLRVSIVARRLGESGARCQNRRGAGASEHESFYPWGHGNFAVYMKEKAESGIVGILLHEHQRVENKLNDVSGTERETNLSKVLRNSETDRITLIILID